ncbi:hypothetical protein HBI80_096760 [Parastagonospora nodorum]|nr:hypothetical protein HBI80_096760 [Parastagonospora nodorum]KAH5338064.1 hypothetical protein HBI12_019230 [Parastagonospora nodorum]KAH5447043.1 hypothetical protein HBI47_020470 [Parastagonospora nodorum]KAH6311914.1 hypothetical protein HBI39_062920 [Parastagonospora nodorum]
MPVTFGAVGDIISVCHLVKGLVDALDKARGSKAEYLSAVQELSILEKVLFEIACIIEEHGDGATPELQSLCETAKQAFTRCEALVDAFLQRTRRYQGTLTETAKPEVLHEATMKLRWRLAEKEALKNFRVEVAGISESLQMLLGAANIILRTETKVKLEEADQRYQAANSIQRAQLKDVLDRIENVNESIKTGNVMLYKIADALKMDWLRQLGSELKLLLYRSVAVNFATYQAVRRQQTPLPSHVEHGLIDEPFILEDAIGRKAPVHLQFITSWEAFDSILEIRFCGRQGHQKVIHKQYELQDGRTGRNLERSQSWERAFLPVQRVQMSILFHKQRPIDSGCAGIICPGCQTPAENALETDIHCKQCFIWYSRIAVVEYADHWEHAILGRLHKISSGDDLVLTLKVV